MAGGISPNKIVTIQLEDYNRDHYLTLFYQAMLNLGWHIGYFDHDGIIAYTNISLASYSEEISARVKGRSIIIKSECVGYQGFFTDYGKNGKNLDLLFGEISYAEFHLQENLDQVAQDLMNEVPEKQFLSLDHPPMEGKEQLRGFFSPFIPVDKYFITPLLVILNILIYIGTAIALKFLPHIVAQRQPGLDYAEMQEKVYMTLGFSNRNHVLNGEVWRLLTSTFLHFSLLHLAGNMIVLVYIGSLVEVKLGRWNYLLMFLFTGIISGMVSVFWNLSVVSAGASGAIFGLFGILLALLSTDFYERSARKALLISTAIVVVLNIIPGEGIDNAAHFGGLISGYIFGWIAYLGLNHRNSFVKKWGIVLSGAFIVIAFVACGEIFSVRYQLKEYEVLSQKIDDLNVDINSKFYADSGVTRQVRLDIMEQEGLPEVKKMTKMAEQYVKLRLPSKKAQDAKVKARIINLYCQYYQYLYLEFKEHTPKYRPQIDSLTDKINSVRSSWTESN